MLENFNYQINLIKRLLVREYPILSRFLTVNYGIDNKKLKEDEESDKHYLMGASDDKIEWKVINPESNYLQQAREMINELQKGRFVETMGCTGYALNNVEELIEITKGYERINRSDRFLNKISGTTKRGNSLSNVLECRRQYGFVREEDWTWDRDKFRWYDYYAPLPPEVKDKALINNKIYDFGYDGVWATKSMLHEALKYSPLYVALYAWYERGGLYYSVGRANHASVIINRDTFIDYDSYEPHIKYLSEGFKVYYVKRIHLEKREKMFNEENIQNLIKEGRKYVIRPNSNGEFYKIYKDRLEFIPDIKVIADQVAKDLKQSPKDVNTMLKFLTDTTKELKWISEKEYNNLLK